MRLPQKCLIPPSSLNRAQIYSHGEASAREKAVVEQAFSLLGFARVQLSEDADRGNRHSGSLATRRACSYDESWKDLPVPGKKKKLTLDEAAEALTRIAEEHLSKLPEDEQESRVAAFSRVNFKKSRGTRAKSSATSRTRASRAAGRGRG